jgi:hypothetical protein
LPRFPQYGTNHPHESIRFGGGVKDLRDNVALPLCFLPVAGITQIVHVSPPGYYASFSFILNIIRKITIRDILNLRGEKPNLGSGNGEELLNWT